MDGGKVKLDLKPCKNCGRTFVPESLAKHEKSCKTVQKKRKPFDTAKQRATEDLSLKQIKAAQKKVVKPPKTNWKAKHLDLVNNIRAARGAQVAMDRGDPLPPPPPPSLNPDYVACPYCSRRFNEKAAERHISFCKEQQSRLPNKRQPSEQEKKRAAAKNFQVPKPKGRGDSPSMSGGGYGGGYSDSPGRGGYSNSPASRGGYSNSPASRGGYSNSPASRGGRAAPEASRGPVAGGYSSRGRAPTGPTARGRAAPSSQFNNNSSVSPNQVDIGAGPALRTGRDGNVYEEACREARDRGSGPRNKGTFMAREDMPDSHKVPQKRVTSGHSRRTTESGYYSNSPDLDTNSTTKPKTSAMTTANFSKFCHECGAKYPIPGAKFCCECGLQRISC